MKVSHDDIHSIFIRSRLGADHGVRRPRSRIPCLMIHYTCDRCKRQIDTAEQTRYIVQIEIQSAADEPVPPLASVDLEDDVDQLNELNEFLEGLHDESLLDNDEPLSHFGRYDLCPDCHHQFLKNPLGRDAMAALGFSNN